MSKRSPETGDDEPTTKRIKGRELASKDGVEDKKYDLPEYTAYDELAEQYPGLQAHLLRRHGPSATGGHKYTMDFKKAEAVRVLNQALLRVYFDLGVVLPSNALCPAVESRLNYIKWLGHNIVEEMWPGTAVRGLDIGTGASCIYPLLGARYLRGSEFVGTDINEESVAVARQNVDANSLGGRIQVFLNKDRTTVLPIDSPGFPLPDHGADGSIFTFCMCNPPFYESREERQKLRQMKQIGQPTLDTGGKDDELYTEGGEEAFVGRLVEESAVHRTRIRWYTTMVGKKGTLKPLKAKIREAGAKHISECSLIQGRTTRWVLAWTFLDKSRFCLDVKRSADDARSWIEAAMDELRIQYGAIDGEAVASYMCSAVEKTWTRQWRRQQQRAEAGEPEESGDKRPVIEFKVAVVRKEQDSSQICMYVEAGYGSNVLMSLYNHLLRKSDKV
ncbi:Methyltransferase-like protein 16 [Coemansia sp. RSA 1933]|nr:Methyltransferase-like protein 16 [Coemansia sp. RSA 1933]